MKFLNKKTFLNKFKNKKIIASVFFCSSLILVPAFAKVPLNNVQSNVSLDNSLKLTSNQNADFNNKSLAYKQSYNNTIDEIMAKVSAEKNLKFKNNQSKEVLIQKLLLLKKPIIVQTQKYYLPQIQKVLYDDINYENYDLMNVIQLKEVLDDLSNELSQIIDSLNGISSGMQSAEIMSGVASLGFGAIPFGLTRSAIGIANSALASARDSFNYYSNKIQNKIDEAAGNLLKLAEIDTNTLSTLQDIDDKARSTLSSEQKQISRYSWSAAQDIKNGIEDLWNFSSNVDYLLPGHNY